MQNNIENLYREVCKRFPEIISNITDWVDAERYQKVLQLYGKPKKITRLKT